MSILQIEIAAPMQDVNRENTMQAFMMLREQAAKDFPQGMELDEINEEIRKVRYGEEESE